MEKEVQGYLFSTDKLLLDQKRIHEFLSQESYWSKNIPYQKVADAIKGSDCFGVYKDRTQVGFARVITDHATFAYMADVFVLPQHRGKGISKQLVKFILEYPAYQGVRRFMLATLDAHGLYAQFGFQPLSTPDRFMELKPFESYS